MVGHFKILQHVKCHWKCAVIILVPLLFLPLAASGYKPMQCGYVIAIVSIFWITEVIDLAVTSFIPIVLFPAFGILTPKMVAACYMKDITLMLLGGLIVAKTIEKQNLHKRLAIRVLKFMGPNPIFQYMGFMLSTWFLSMWISNTATTAMMITLADAVVVQWQLMANCTKVDQQETTTVACLDSETMENSLRTYDDKDEISNYEIKRIETIGKGLFLGIAYSAACGGIATLSGTGPNLVFYGFIEERYGSRMNLNFTTFMWFSLPLSVITIFVTWVLLCFRYIGYSSIVKRKIDPIRDKKTMKLIDEELNKLGFISYGEISTLIVFGILVLLWVLREPGIPLWGSLFIYKSKNGKSIKYWSDAISAITAALLVFFLPAKNPFKVKVGNEKLMDWKYIETRFSWAVIFLFGGGFALAAGCEKSGLSNIIGNLFGHLETFPHYAIILIVAFSTSLLTELMSNLATVTILLPIIFQMAECINMHPMMLGLSTTIACSFSFCLPCANPPNTIVFSTGKLRVIDMASTGFILNILCVAVLSVMTYYYSVPIFHTDTFPIWIKVNCSQNR